METFQSDISNKEFPISEKVSGKAVRQSILDLIQTDNPKFTADNFLSISELNHYRAKHIESFLTRQIGKLSGLELSLIHISEPTRLAMISYDVFCLKKKKKTKQTYTIQYY